MIPGESPAHDATLCIRKQFRNDPVDSATVTSLPTVTKQLCSSWEELMGTKTYSGFQNILFTTHWNMSQKASRFHFEHYSSLQDWRPPNQVFYQNICIWYQMKSDSKKTELGHTTSRTSDDAFEFFEFVTKMCLSCCYFAQYATKCNMTTKHIEKSCHCTLYFLSL